MWPTLVYVDSLSYFQQGNSNWDIVSLSSSLDSKLGFLNIGLRLYLKIFPNSQKDRACLRIAIPAYCFNSFGSIFGVLFYLLDRKLILRSSLTKYEKFFRCSLKCRYITPDGRRRNVVFFLKNAHSYVVWNFLRESLFHKTWKFKNESEDLAINLSARKMIDFSFVQLYGGISALWLLDTIYNMPKSVLT